MYMINPTIGSQVQVRNANDDNDNQDKKKKKHHIYYLFLTHLITLTLIQFLKYI